MTDQVSDVGPELSPQDFEEKFWKKDFLPFHKSQPFWNLEKNYDATFGKNPKSRMFVPLCGKSLDMVWLAKKGHEVVGLEFSSIAVNSFFKEQGLEYSKGEVPGSALVKYKAKGVNVTIYHGDFFDATPQILGTFGAVWDRAAFTTMHPANDLRKRYLAVMKTLLEKNYMFLINVFVHDCNHKGSPYTIDYKTLQETCGQMFDCKVISEGEYLCKYISRTTPVGEVLYQIIPKE